LALGLTVTGAVALGVGGYLGFRAFSKAGKADCSRELECSEAGLRQRRDAQRILTAGYVTGAVGAVLLGVGTWMLFDDDGAEPGPNLGVSLNPFDVGDTQLTLSGRF
jgi:hypothetical protein